jgi:uncharacterized lipoprotein YmbA
MKPNGSLLQVALFSASIVLLAGCLFKPAAVSARRFVLAPLARVSANEAPTTKSPISVGVSLVKMPTYLLRGALAVRKGTNEIQYMEDALWAEPLDQGFQRTLAANLSKFLPTEQIYLSTWGRDQVKVRVFIIIEQFDVDTEGHGQLSAWWRLTPSTSDTPLKSGQVHLTRTGARPGSNSHLIVAALSELNAEFSRLLADEIREFTSAHKTDK